MVHLAMEASFQPRPELHRASQVRVGPQVAWEAQVCLRMLCWPLAGRREEGARSHLVLEVLRAALGSSTPPIRAIDSVLADIQRAVEVAHLA